jgi:branched-chain amino acid transport system ATP-binding protein
MATILKCVGVTKKFGGFTAVESFSAEIEENTIVGLIGPNGAGKTTLFNMISCSFPPTEGQIFYKGNDITGKTAPEVAKIGIARTFQITKPFGDMNVLENIMVGAFLHEKKADVARKKAMDVYELLKFHSPYSQSAHSLTTVDRKKLEVARALATGPELLLLDEVMAGCNAQEKTEICEVIADVQKEGITVLVIEHDIKTIMTICEVIHMLHRGQNIASGTPQEVSSNPEAISAYLGEEYEHVSS